MRHQSSFIDQSASCITASFKHKVVKGTNLNREMKKLHTCPWSLTDAFFSFAPAYASTEDVAARVIPSPGVYQPSIARSHLSKRTPSRPFPDAIIIYLFRTIPYHHIIPTTMLYHIHHDLETDVNDPKGHWHPTQ